MPKNAKNYAVQLVRRVMVRFADGPAVTNGTLSRKNKARRAKAEAIETYQAARGALLVPMLVGATLAYLTGQFWPDGQLATASLWLTITAFAIGAARLGWQSPDHPTLPIAFAAAVYPYASVVTHVMGYATGASGDAVHAFIPTLAFVLSVTGLPILLVATVISAFKRHGWLDRQRDMLAHPAPMFRLMRWWGRQ